MLGILGSFFSFFRSFGPSFRMLQADLRTSRRVDTTVVSFF